MSSINFSSALLNFLFEKSGAKKVWYLKKLQKNIDKADYITTISDYTKKSIEEHINLRGKSILTIYNGIDSSYPVTVHKPYFMGNKKFYQIDNLRKDTYLSMF